MQDFRDNKKKKLVAILDIISGKFVMGYHCASHYIMFYIHGPVILHFFLSYVNITKLLKFKMATIQPF